MLSHVIPGVRHSGAADGHGGYGMKAIVVSSLVVV